MKWGPATALIVFIVPSLASAQVVINEIMYNPQGSDSGREWVELYNSGTADETMVGGSGKGSWRINDGSNHTLTDPNSGTGRGSLTIPAGGYLVVANDPNDFISGEYANSGTSSFSVVKSSLSLSNNGGALTLTDGTGAIIDTASFTPTQGGNDDTSSLQRQPDGSWIAALPTPGALNATVAYTAPQTPANSSGGSSSSSQTDQTQSNNSSYVPPPAPSLYAEAGGNRSVIVAADAVFDASAYDKMQTLLDPTNVRFLWNFGDGTSAEGAAVLHHFSYPGRYAVVLQIAQNKNAAMDEIVVTAEAAAMSFSLLSDGGIEIKNLAEHDLDLSGWVIQYASGNFSNQFILPETSKLLAGSSMRVSPTTLQFRASSSTMLEYPNGALALAMGESTAATNAQVPATIPIAASQQIAAAVSRPKIDPIADQRAETAGDSQRSVDVLAGTVESDYALSSDALDATGSSPVVLQAAVASSVSTSTFLWWLGVGALALAAGCALIATLHFKRSEWDIQEEAPG